MTVKKATKSNISVLLIEDDEEYIQGIQGALSKANYKVNVARTAKKAFQEIFKSPANLIILDINLQDLDGFHFVKELKRNMMLRHIPVILLSSRADFLEKMRTLDVVVDEYLVKPIDYSELVVRIKLVLKRIQSTLDANPLTRLPGNMAIVKGIKERIASKKPFAVGYVDLNNFKAYNDKYGFNKGDQVIRLAARVIISVVQKYSAKQSFVGHVGGDDFVFICSYEKANEVCEGITQAFDREIPKFYSEEDKKKGYIVVEDRRGVVSQFPIVSVAIGLASDEGGKFNNLGQMNHALTQLKKYAKSFQGSAYVRDRRNLASKLAEFTWGPGSVAQTQEPDLLDNITKALDSYMPAKLAEVMKKEEITVLFQPIIDMEDDEVVAHESLVRGPAGSPLEYPDALFQTARNAKCVPQLDAMCVKKILDCTPEFHRGIKIFINLYPETLLEAGGMEQEIFKDPRVKDLELIFEVAGSQRASDATELFASLRRLKEKGVKICVDASLVLVGHGIRHLPELRPDYIKLNMVKFKDLATDRQKQEEFMKAVRIIRQVGSQAICTKLESRADSFMARRYGVILGQGFLFARPALPSTQSPVK